MDHWFLLNGFYAELNPNIQRPIILWHPPNILKTKEIGWCRLEQRRWSPRLSVLPPQHLILNWGRGYLISEFFKFVWSLAGRLDKIWRCWLILNLNPTFNYFLLWDPLCMLWFMYQLSNQTTNLCCSNSDSQFLFLFLSILVTACFVSWGMEMDGGM